MPFAISTLTDAIPQHRAGNVRILAVGSETRSPFLPDAPTLKESGVDLVADAWYGMWLPAGASPDFAKKLSEAAAAALAKPEVKEKLLGDRPDPGRLDARRPDPGARRQHRLLAADREGDGVQDHELRIYEPHPEKRACDASRSMKASGRNPIAVSRMHRVTLAERHLREKLSQRVAVPGTPVPC